MKRGRPCKQPIDRRTVTFRICLTKDEREAIRVQAEVESQNDSAWARGVLMDKCIVSAFDIRNDRERQAR